MPGELVVGYDGSAAATAALAKAVDLARALGRGVVVVFASEPPASGAEVGDHRAALQAHGEKLLAGAVAEIDHDGVMVGSVIVHERPADALLDLAAQHSSPMIVVGTNAERPLMQAILGSVPLKLLHRSSIPVLVVPAPGAGPTVEARA